MKNHRELFVIPPGIWSALSYDEIAASWQAMRELGIDKPPFDRFDVDIPEAECFRLVHKDGTTETYPTQYFARWTFDVATDGAMASDCLISARGNVKLPLRNLDAAFDPKPFGDSLLMALCVLLATKNVIKERKERKAAKLGIGKGHSAITTLRIGEITEHEGASGAGIKRHPHLRRGHKRDQRWGPGLTLVKTIFIAPQIINADEEWIGQREAYTLRMAPCPIKNFDLGPRPIVHEGANG